MPWNEPKFDLAVFHLAGYLPPRGATSSEAHTRRGGDAQLLRKGKEPNGVTPRRSFPTH